MLSDAGVAVMSVMLTVALPLLYEELPRLNVEGMLRPMAYDVEKIPEEFAPPVSVIVVVDEMTSVDVKVCVPAVSVVVPVTMTVTGPEFCAELEEPPLVLSF